MSVFGQLSRKFPYIFRIHYGCFDVIFDTSRKPVVADIMNSQPKLLDQVRDVLQGRHYSCQTEMYPMDGTCRVDRLNVAEWVNQMIKLTLF